MVKVTSSVDGKVIQVECAKCYDEEGSMACVRAAHRVQGEPILAKNETYGGCAEGARERREKPKRMSDLFRAVNKVVEDTNGLVERKSSMWDWEGGGCEQAELPKVLAVSKPTMAPYEETMLLLRFKIYDLITEHVPDRELSLNLKKLVEYNFR
jgi:hypothetical protein